VADFEIVNVVGTITYQQELELSALADTFENRNEISSVSYEPEENHWLQVRFAPDDTYTPFYRSGKCSIVGTKSIEDFDEMVERVNSLMDELLCFDYEPIVEINNIVTTAEIDSIPSLETIVVELGFEQTEYEPEQFPALIHRGGEDVMLIFPSGKLICTGLTNFDQISSAIDHVTTQIKNITTE
jgi:TATA-box binding protein (TBP), component of TFIID and TFIIIB